MNFELLTSKNVGAISVFSIKGNVDEITDFMSKFWRIKRSGNLQKIKIPKTNQVIYGYFVDNDEIIDEALLIGISDGIIELHVHGGFGVVERVIRILSSHGYSQIENDFNEITRLFVSSRTKNEARLILEQSKVLKNTSKELIHLIENKDLFGLRNLSEKIISCQTQYEILKNPPVVFLLGKPNVGKSTLFNQLAGFERVITSDVSGTTRDVVSQIINIEGWSIKLSDAAGVRRTEDYIERRSVVRSLRKVREAGLIIFITDVSTELSDEEKQIISELDKLNHIKVLNKCDAVDSFKKESHELQISAKTGAGIDELKKEILAKTGFKNIDKNKPLPIHPLNKEFLVDLSKTDNPGKYLEILDSISKSFDINVI